MNKESIVDLVDSISTARMEMVFWSMFQFV